MAKSKTIKLNGKKITYKTIPQLAKILKQTKEQTTEIVRMSQLRAKVKKALLSKKRTIEFRGKMVRYRNPFSLAKQLKIGVSGATKLIKDIKSGNTKRYLEINGKTARYDIRNKNKLLLKDFDIKSIANKNFISTGYTTGKKTKIYDILPSNKRYEIYVVAKYTAKWSNSPPWKNKWSGIIKTATVDIGNPSWDLIIMTKIQEAMADEWGDAEPDDLRIDERHYFNKQGGQEYKKSGIFLLDNKPLNMDHLFNDIIPNEGSNNCVVNYLKRIWKGKIKTKRFINLHTVDDIYQFCVENDIRMRAVDANRKVIRQNLTQNKKVKAVNFLACNNHLYPLGKRLNKVFNPKVKKLSTNKDILVEDAHKEFKKFLEQGILPRDMFMPHDKIIMFSVDKTRYFENKDYEACKKILDKFGLSEHLEPLTNLLNISSIIEKLYLKTSISSFLPKANRFVKGAVLYKKDDKVYDDEDIFSFDKNKAFSNALKRLTYLIKTDIRYNKKYILRNVKNIIDHHLYYVKVDRYCRLLPYNEPATGGFLKKCMDLGIKFTITHSLESDRTEENYYRQMIEDIYEKLPEKQAKTICNIMIGKFASAKEIRRKTKILSVANKDESEASDGIIIPIDEDSDYNLVCSIKESFTIYNRKPIHIQIIEEYRMQQYLKLKELNIDPDDIIQIKTDCISIYNPKIKKQTQKEIQKYGNKAYTLVPVKDSYIITTQSQDIKKTQTTKFCCGVPYNITTESQDYKQTERKYKLKEKMAEYINNNIDGWKYEKYKSINATCNNKELIGFDYDEFFENNNVLCMCYAGAGKTTDIIKQIKLNYTGDVIKEERPPYIVLTPSWASAKEYKQQNINCSVIQGYTLNNTIPDEGIVIFDEIGMMDRKSCDLMYKCMLVRKQLIGYGDYNQLPPVQGESNDSTLWLDLVFNHRKQLDTNYRNNFTKKYYDKLINSPDKSFKEKEITKWGTNYKDAEVIICYRNIVRHMYNTLKCKYLGIPFIDETPIQDGEPMIDINNIKVGTKIIANLNVRSLTKLGIYNKFDFTITKVNDDTVELDNEININKEYLTNIKAGKPWFSFAYARTLYSIQGQSLESYHYPPVDYTYLHHQKNEGATYTIISRLKQKDDGTPFINIKKKKTIKDYYK